MKTKSTDKSAGSENAMDSILEFDMFKNPQQDDWKPLVSIPSVDYFLFHEGSTDESSDWELVSPPDSMTDYVTKWESKETSPSVPPQHDKTGAEFVLDWGLDPEQLEYAMAELSMQEHSVNGKQGNRPGQCVFALSSMKPRKRTKRKHVVGNNKHGRKGALRCDACRRRRSKCVFQDKDIPCESCRERNITTCTKRWGQKTEEILGRPPPTPIDAVISHQDVLLLQFAYSDIFSALGGSLISNLLRRLAYIFSPSISSESLRQVTLAWAAAFLPPDPSNYDRMEYYSTCAGRALQTKTSDTIDESDIYAVSLLTVLSCVFRNGPKFEIHLKGFLVIMEEVSKKTWNREKASQLSTIHHLWMFLPLVRDLIIEMSRIVFIPNSLVVHFSSTCQRIIGPASFKGRAQYFQELFGVDPYQRNTFCNSVWHHCTVLRRCFREVVSAQIEGLRINTTISRLVAEAKADLLSSDMEAVVRHLLMKYSKSGSDSRPSRENDDAMEFALLLYAFCSLLIILLQQDTLIQGLTSPKASHLARSMLRLIEDKWLRSGNLYWNCEVPSPYIPRYLVVRILWMAGLILNKEVYPDVMNFVVNTLEVIGEGHFARALELFWREPDYIQLGEMLNMPCMWPSPNYTISL